MIEAHAIRQKALRLWTSNRLLCDWLEPDGLFPHRISAGSPSGRRLSEAYAQVKDWIAQIESGAGAGYQIEYRAIEHRQLGPQQIPARIVIPSRDDCLRLIRKRHDFDRFRSIAESTLPAWPALRNVFLKRPHDIINLAEHWEGCLSVCRYFVDRPRPGLYLRQLDIPGVDTKFIEQHRSILSNMLDHVLPETAIDPTESGGLLKGFSRRYGLAIEHPTIRLRVLDPNCMVGGLRDFAVPLPDLARRELDIDTVFITENKTNGLCLPDCPRSIVIFGLGYGVESICEVAWLSLKNIYYWGDIDTHGFRILNQLRGYFPHLRSMLMDEKTLINNLPLCVEEPEATRFTGQLQNLTKEESATYTALLDHRLGRSLRLEQERIGFSGVESFMRSVAS